MSKISISTLKSTLMTQRERDEREKKFLQRQKEKEEKLQRENQEETKRRLVRTSNIPKIFQDKRAKDFKITPYNEKTAQLAIRAITENIGLYIYGDCGQGKTMLSSVIAIERAQLLKESTFICVSDLFNELNPFNSRNGETNAYIRKQQLKNSKCLILDDLGVEKPTEFTNTILFEIVNHRYNNNLQTIINSNFSLAELKNRIKGYEGERVIRRLKAICIETNINDN